MLMGGWYGGAAEDLEICGTRFNAWQARNLRNLKDDIEAGIRHDGEPPNVPARRRLEFGRHLVTHGWVSEYGST